MRSSKSVFAAIVVVALAVFAASAFASAASDGPGQGKPRVNAGNGVISAALQRDLGLSAEEARARGALQGRAIQLDQTLRASLGESFAGSLYDAKSGKLIVMVSDPKQLEKAKAAGAEPRLVKHSAGDLKAIKEELDLAAGKPKGASAANRQPNGKRQASIAGMTTWYIDPTSNSVRVTVKTGEANAARRTLAKYGDAVTIEESELTPTLTSDYMDGGDLVNGSSCSAGFNLRNASTGQGYLLTAGHCVTAGSTLSGQGSVAFGRVLESWIPAYDDAIVRNDSGGYWLQGPWVDQNPSNGGIVNAFGYSDAPVGTAICKSGVTTKWTCGSITAKDETVNTERGTIYGLTRHNACVERGDSGGATIAMTTPYRAEGVTSAAQLRTDGTRERCLSVFGETNVSWYYPIADSLEYYLKYGVRVW